jgi:hypothetical protein
VEMGLKMILILYSLPDINYSELCNDLFKKHSHTLTIYSVELHNCWRIMKSKGCLENRYGFQSGIFLERQRMKTDTSAGLRGNLAEMSSKPFY